jgi:hypothetical protein
MKGGGNSSFILHPSSFRHPPHTLNQHLDRIRFPQVAGVGIAQQGVKALAVSVAGCDEDGEGGVVLA